MLSQKLEPFAEEGAGGSPDATVSRFGWADAETAVEEVGSTQPAGFGDPQEVGEGEEDSAIEKGVFRRDSGVRRRQPGEVKPLPVWWGSNAGDGANGIPILVLNAGDFGGGRRCQRDSGQ